MVVQAYILVQTNVGKAAEVAHAISAIQGVHVGRRCHGSLRRHRPRRKPSSVDELGQLVVAAGANGAWHHTHCDLSCRSHLARHSPPPRRDQLLGAVAVALILSGCSVSGRSRLHVPGPAGPPSRTGSRRPVPAVGAARRPLRCAAAFPDHRSEGHQPVLQSTAWVVVEPAQGGYLSSPRSDDPRTWK